MSKIISNILKLNKEFINSINKSSPGLLNSLKSGQKPYALVIGCSDSRVPFTQLSNGKPVYLNYIFLN